MTPGSYLRRSREAAGKSIDDVALATETEPPVSHQRRVEWLKMIEADVESVSISTACALLRIYPFDPIVLEDLVEREPRALTWCAPKFRAARDRPTAPAPSAAA